MYYELYYKIMSIKNALEQTGKGSQFSVVCCSALILFGVLDWPMETLTRLVLNGILHLVALPFGMS